MGVVATLIFFLLILIVGIFLMARYYGNTLDLDVRWLIGALMVSVSVFHLTAFVCHCILWLVGWLI